MVRYGWKTLAVILTAALLIWLIFWLYVELNEQKLIGRITRTLQEKIHAEVKISNLSVSFIRTFPLLSLQVTGIKLRDSFYTKHHKDMFSADDVYLRISIPGLLINNSPIGKVIIRNGTVNILTDSVGNTNEYVLNPDEKQKNSGIPEIVLNNVVINYENALRNKHHNAIIRTLKFQAKEKNGLTVLDAKLYMQVNSLAFNTVKGAFLKNKIIRGNMELVFEKKTRKLHIQNVKLELDRQPFYFNGYFVVDKISPDFKLSIRTRDADFSKAVSLLNDNINKKTGQFSFTKPVNFSVNLSGKTLYRFIPLVQVELEVNRNKLSTPKGMFEDCNFLASFTNETVFGEPRTDANSSIHVKNFTGKWENIFLSSKSLKISNISRPYLECDITAEIGMKSFNTLAGSATLQFLGGRTTMNIVFSGPVNGEDSASSNINGEIKFYDAAIKYLPRNFSLSAFNGSLKFINNDLVVNNIKATAGKTRLQMTGNAKNFLSMLQVSPEKLVLNWKIYSPEIHLEDFKGFAAKTEPKQVDKKDGVLKAAASKVDKMFSDGDMYINIEAPVMQYKTFRATDVKARVILKPAEIAIDKVQLKHAHGSMDITGSLKNGIKYNPVTLHTSMRNMDIPMLFAAFDNFGQDAITDKNLKGKLSAEVDLITSINNNAELVEGASEGAVRFILKDGELNNFAPLSAIAEKAFKKQDFSQIRFADLENKLDIKGTAFIVNPMEIRSTALNFSVEGVYDVKKGTDMSIRLPLTNLTRSQADTDISDEGKTKKGVGLRLRARTGDDGKLKISWDPFKRSIKKKEQAKDSVQEKN